MSALGASPPLAAGLRFQPLNGEMKRSIHLFYRRSATRTAVANIVQEVIMAQSLRMSLVNKVRWA
jgi:hypothetical protein